MNILVVDDEQSYGSLLGRALRRLGHKPIVASHPVDALEVFRDKQIDAVITDIDMPVMTGVELARRLRCERADLPIAFCTGSNRDDDITSQALAIGIMLPKVWTVADVKRVLTNLQSGVAKPKQFARGSQQGLPGADTPPIRTRPPTQPMRRVVRKVKVSCKTWEQVAQLCSEQSTGRHRLTVTSPSKVQVGERVTVALSLPDELVLSIAAEVSRVRLEPGTGRSMCSISLTGLTPEVCTRLRSLINDAGGARQLSSYHKHKRGDSPRGAAVVGNVRARPKTGDRR